jgi:hypothetical protein
MKIATSGASGRGSIEVRILFCTRPVGAKNPSSASWSSLAAPTSGSLSAPSLAIVAVLVGRKGTETSVTCVPSGRVTLNVGL